MLEEHHLKALDLLRRHVTGDFGDLSPEDEKANWLAIEEGTRIFSSYVINAVGEKVWIITESDRSLTKLLLPEEY